MKIPMKAMSRAITTTLTATIFLTLSASLAHAGCGSMTDWRGTFPPIHRFAPRAAVQVAPTGKAAEQGPAPASIVGMWDVQLISLGNTTHNPPIPDGAVIDFGYNQLHSDGTEILNSGGHAPATENFCLGVWAKTGYLAYEVNHFALSYDAVSGMLVNKVNIREQISLSPSGDSYTGTFTLDVYDTSGNHVDHVVGTLMATRVTVDTTLP